MRAIALDMMGLGEDNNCPSFLAGYSALSFLVPSITSLLLVASSSIWFRARQPFYLRALGVYKIELQTDNITLGLGGYYLWLWFFSEIHTEPGSYKFTCL